MTYTGKEAGFDQMKQIMLRGLVVTGFDNGETTCVFFPRLEDARNMARAINLSDKEEGEVRQFLFDASGVPQGTANGLVLGKNDRPMPTPRGQFGLFCVRVGISKAQCESLLPEVVASGNMVHYKPGAKIGGHMLKLVKSEPPPVVTV